MNGELMLYRDQYGNCFFASTLEELKEKVSTPYARHSEMYRDTDQGTVHVGYVISGHWLEAYRPVRNPVQA